MEISCSRNNRSISVIFYFISHFFYSNGTDWLEKAGIRANLETFRFRARYREAFKNREIDIGYIGLPPAIIGIGRGVPIICVAGGHVEGTVLIARKGYRTLSELQ